MSELKINADGLQGLRLVPEEGELTARRNTSSVAAQALTPGEVAEDGSWIDSYGMKHYASGAKYKFSPADKRLTAHGAYSGRYQEPVHKSDTEEGTEPLETIGGARLKPRDLQTALLYLKGLSRRDMAAAMEVCEQTITTRLSRADVRAYLTEQKTQYTEDIHALTEMAIDVLRDSMDSNVDMKYRLTGADKVLRANERLGSTKPAAKEETATTQLQQVLAAIRGEHITINM